MPSIHPRNQQKKITQQQEGYGSARESFKKNVSIATEMTNLTRKRAVSSIAAKRLVNRVLQVHKHYAGSLLKAIRLILNC